MLTVVSRNSEELTVCMLRGKLFIFDTRILFVGENLANEVHKHYTASIIVSRDGPLNLTVNDKHIQCRGVMVYPNERQSLDARGRRFFSLQVDRETPTFGAIEHLFGQKKYLIFDDHVVDDLNKLDLDGISPENADVMWRSIISMIGGKDLSQPVVDGRIRKVANHLKENLAEVPNAHSLAELAEISQSRLIHLFTQQLGLPIRSYVKWLRLRRAVEEISASASLTDAAHLAGFSDSAHLSRTFKEMFGISPKNFTQNAQFVQVFSGEA